MTQFGASFSAPYARHLDLDPKACLESAITDLNLPRLRLMSYWNRLEPEKGKYDWSELDWQIEMASKYGVEVTLCLGLRQPRWPENHWPDWALKLPDAEWQASLMVFIEKTIRRYRDYDCIESYQLENEALNRSFGENGDFSRKRLRGELELVKSLDNKRPVIMTTSNSWGLPLRAPRPDVYGLSIYRSIYQNNAYRRSKLKPWMFRFRAALIKLIQQKPVFIHELQAEPWGPKAIPDMSLTEQYKSMNLNRIQQAVNFAKSTNLPVIDLWGLEWWYWLKIKHNDPRIWDYISSTI